MEYKAFLTKLQTPEIKRPSSEIAYDSNKEDVTKIDHKNIPLIKYLRERAEKTLQEKRLLRRAGSGSGKTSGSGEVFSGGGSNKSGGSASKVTSSRGNSSVIKVNDVNIVVDFMLNLMLI